MLIVTVSMWPIANVYQTVINKDYIGQLMRSLLISGSISLDVFYVINHGLAIDGVRGSMSTKGTFQQIYLLYYLKFLLNLGLCYCVV